MSRRFLSKKLAPVYSNNYCAVVASCKCGLAGHVDSRMDGEYTVAFYIQLTYRHQANNAMCYVGAKYKMNSVPTQLF